MAGCGSMRIAARTRALGGLRIALWAPYNEQMPVSGLKHCYALVVMFLAPLGRSGATPCLPMACPTKWQALQGATP
eukprot:5998616-Alexandrium_andersonii.AAC.1